MYIAIEGIDTAGKSTQISLLAQNFSDAIITKEPGGTKVGCEIRDIVLSTRASSSKAEFLLFLADRAEHIDVVVKPNIDKMIISDRSVVSGVAYALIKGSIDEATIIELNNFATSSLLPKKVFLLRLTKEELEYRLSQKELDGIELRGSEYLLKIQEALEKASSLLGIELIIIDATKSIQNINKEILKGIQND